MPSERIERVQELFLQALEQPAEDRQRWLESKCGHDSQLLSEVNSLLSYHEQAEDPLEKTPALASSLPRDLPRSAEVPAIRGYEIVREIGAGGQAIVYEAVQTSTTQRVALKRLRWGRFASEHEQQRFRREVVVLADLKHPNIVSIIDCVEAEDGTPFLVTELVEGDSIDRLFRPDRNTETIVARSNLLQLFLKIVRAVDYAHKRGIVHRDLKPANILIDGHAEPQILDFGLAKPAFGSKVDVIEPEQLTFTGQFMGSLP